MHGRSACSVAMVDAVREGIWDVEAAERYDTPGIGMSPPEVVGPTVDRLANSPVGGERWSS